MQTNGKGTAVGFIALLLAALTVELIWPAILLTGVALIGLWYDRRKGAYAYGRGTDPQPHPRDRAADTGGRKVG